MYSGTSKHIVAHQSIATGDTAVPYILPTPQVQPSSSVLVVLSAELGDAVIRDGELLLGGGEDYSEVVGVLEALQQERGWREPNKPREQKETVRECGTEKGERTT